ncbi:hypothetical protein [Hyphomicrobium sp. CS1GBMeth3]|uniref:hypothetical protein n=1 Tax=Hyphomicrobium sp. CS1GBMeth3 TaxID=1892845 RepID=UPI0009309B30|nr:hypothetical protein [Hyphomicrobium sp. CS1GBMeth3]
MSDIRIGDVVTLPGAYFEGARWVVAGFQGSPAGVPSYAHLKLISKTASASYTAYPQALEFIERPEFEIGQRVTVNSMPGEIVAEDPEQHQGEKRFQIRLEAYRQPIPGGGQFRHENAKMSVPAWALTVENRT